MKEEELYDLTPSQQLMYYAVKYSIKKSVVNIGVSIWIKDNMDISLLEKAIYIAISRMDALKIRLTEINNVTKQYVSMEEVRETEVYDFSELTVDEIDKKLTKWTSTVEKFKDCYLYKISILKVPNDETVVYVKVNHIIMDAWGLTVFTKDILDIYTSIRDNKMLPEAPTSFIELVKEDLKYRKSKKRDKDYEFWKEVFKNPPSYASVNKENVGKPYRNLSVSTKSALKVITLEKERVNKIKEFCKKNYISPQILFILGSQCYFYIINNTCESIINNSLARRSNMKSKRAGGMMVNSLPFKIICSKESSFIETCNKLTMDQMSLFRHGDFPYQDIMAYIKEQYPVKNSAYSYTDMCFTYQVAKINSINDVSYIVKSYSNGTSAMGIYLTIMDVSDSGTLDFLFEYTLSLANEEVINRIYKLMIKVVELGISKPEMSIGEILEVVKGELE